jgi:gamma-glutamyl phosphate reductase
MHAQTRVRILRKVADGLESHEALIMERNARDVATAEARGIDTHLLQRLRLRPEKIRTLARGIRAIADMEEPLRKVRRASLGSTSL